MNRSEKLALFLGMLSGDGCLSISHNGEGYRNYPIQFCNNDKNIVLLFAELFHDLFGIEGKIHSRTRIGRKKIWEFKKISIKIVSYLRELGFPEGVKRDILRVPKSIINGSQLAKKYFFFGVFITDGSLKKNRGIMFHMGSKLFLEDVSLLVGNLTGTKSIVKEYIQQEKYKSYQLYLNKKESELLLSNMPGWDNGTPTVLRYEIHK